MVPSAEVHEAFAFLLVPLRAAFLASPDLSSLSQLVPIYDYKEHTCIIYLLYYKTCIQ